MLKYGGEITSVDGPCEHLQTIYEIPFRILIESLISAEISSLQQERPVIYHSLVVIPNEYTLVHLKANLKSSPEKIHRVAFHVENDFLKSQRDVVGFIRLLRIATENCVLLCHGLQSQ
jgi:hypothetical protein